MMVDHVGIEAWKIARFAWQNYVPRTVEMKTWLSCLHCPQLSAMICYKLQNRLQLFNRCEIEQKDKFTGVNVPADHSFEF